MVVFSKIVAVYYKTYVVMRIFQMERVLFFFLYCILMVVVIVIVIIVVVNWYCCCSRALLSYSKCLPVWPGAGRIASMA